MNDNNLKKPQLTEIALAKEKHPDEVPSLHVEAKCKIWDPESGNVIIEGRG